MTDKALVVKEEIERSQCRTGHSIRTSQVRGPAQGEADKIVR